MSKNTKKKPAASKKPSKPMNTRQMKSTKGGIEQPLPIGSQTSGAGAGKVTFNPF